MSTVKLAVVDGKTITQATELQGGKAAGPMKIRSVKGGKFILGDTKTGHAPENITIKRAGKNLLVSLEGDDLEHPSLIIEDFYGNEAQIVGMGEDGAYHEYVAADAQDEHEAAFLADGADSPLVLGAQNMAGFSGSDLVAAPAAAGAGLGAAGLGAAGWAALGLAGLAAAGMIGAGIIDSRRDNGNNNGGGGDNGGGGGDGPDPANGDHLLPTIGQVIDDVGNNRGPIAPGGFTNDKTPKVIGTGTAPGNKVEIYDNGQKIGEAIVKADGTWEFTPTTGLDDGPHALYVVEHDSTTGAVGKPSLNFEFTLDTVAPAIPTFEVVDQNGDPIGNPTNEAKPVFRGDGAEPGNTVIVRDKDTGEEIGSVVVGEDGSWEISPDTAITDGDRHFEVVVEDPAGNSSHTDYNLEIDTTPPADPTFEVVDQNGNPIDNGATNDTKPIFRGSDGEEGDKIVIRNPDTGDIIGSAIVDQDGNWEIPIDTELDEGDYHFEVIVTDPAGNETGTEYDLIVDTTPPADPTFEVVDQNGNPIDNGATNDTKPIFRGSDGEEGDKIVIRNPDTGDIIGSAIVDQDGNWEIPIDTELDEGDYHFEVIVTDPAGNETGTEYDLIIDTTPPADAVFEVVDQNGNPIGDGETTGDAAPVFRGTGGDEGDTVIVRDENGDVIGTGTVQPDGSWEVKPETPLDSGNHHFDVVIQDPAGNESNPVGHDVNVDLTAPTARALIDDMGKDAGFNDSDWVTNDGSAGRLISGHLDNALATGEKVQVSTDGGATWFDAVVRADGTWFTVDPNAHSADFEIQARVVNGLGTPSTVAHQTVTVDTDVPQAPASVDVQADSIRVDLTGTNAQAGDIVHIRHGKNGSFDHVLSDADIQRGSVDVPTSGLGNAIQQPVSAAIVDQAGNVSDFRSTSNTQWDFSSNTLDGWTGAGKYANQLNVSNGVVETETNSPGSAGWSGEVMYVDVAVVAGQSYTFSFNWASWHSYGAVPRLGLTVDGGKVIDYGPAGRVDEYVTMNGTYVATKTGTVRVAIVNQTDDEYGNDFRIDNIRVSSSGAGAVTPPESLKFEVDAQTSSLYGGTGDNVFTVADVTDFAHITQIAGNGGTDTLKLTGAGQTLDVTALNSGATDKITGIEVFDIGGTGDNTLKLSMNDVLNLGAKDGFTADGYYQVMVKGDAGDRLDLLNLIGGGAGGWQQSGAVNIGGEKYHVYRNDTTKAEVLVQDGITVQTGVIVDTWDFDDGTLQGWTAAGKYVNDLRAANGAVETLTNSPGNNGWAGEVMYLDFAVVAGQAYTFSFDWANVTAHTIGWNQPKLGLAVDGGMVIEYGSLPNDSQFASVNGTYVATKTGTVRVAIVNQTDEEYGNDFRIDNIQVTAEEAPSMVTSSVSHAFDADASVYAGAGDNVFTVDDVGQIEQITGTDGIDTLKLTGADQVLDFSALQGKVSSVEVIDITGTGDNTLKLSLGDVLEQGGKDLFVADGKTQMMVKGNDGDTLELSDLIPDGADVGDWAQQNGTVTVEGAQYNVFVHEGLNAELLVQIGIQTHLDNH